MASSKAGIIVRADPAVRRIVVGTTSGDKRDLQAIPPYVIDALRFYLGFAWPRPVRFETQELRGRAKLHTIEGRAVPPAASIRGQDQNPFDDYTLYLHEYEGRFLTTKLLSVWPDMAQLSRSIRVHRHPVGR